MSTMHTADAAKEPRPPNDAATIHNGNLTGSAPAAAPKPVMFDPLRRHSIRTSYEEIKAKAQHQKPLLGDVCITGQAAVWYAKPNTGKTLAAIKLLTDAIAGDRIRGENVYYFNADDSHNGMLEKLAIMNPFGIETIVPGYLDFAAGDLPTKLRSMAANGSAEGKFLILDTLKKFTSLMEKKEASAFGSLAREFVMQGGTVLALAHTNKRRDNDGKLIYAGTSDILEDFDCAYTIDEIQQDDRGKRVVHFECIKNRGVAANSALYSYSLDEAMSYAERLASFTPMDEAELAALTIEAELLADAEGVEAVEKCITDGFCTKQLLVKEAATRLKISRKRATELIDKYTGADKARHRWDYVVKGHGMKLFDLLNRPPADAVVIDPTDVF